MSIYRELACFWRGKGWLEIGKTWLAPIYTSGRFGDKLKQGKSMAIRVSMAFCKLSDEPLVPFATGVRDGLAGNPTLFPDPPVTPDELDAANKAFGVALVAANQGSVAQTAAKNNARLALIALLRQLAVFVESKARGDVQIILVAGFDFTNRGTARNCHWPSRTSSAS